MAERYASLKHGLVGCWIPSVSGSGFLLPDLSGRGNNGAIVGADGTFFRGSQVGTVISSDGTNDAFSCSPVRSGVNQLCLSTWLKIDTYNNTGGLLAEHSSNYNNNNGFIVDPCGNTGRWEVGITNTSTVPVSYNAWSFTRPTAGVWNHVLTYFDRTQGLNASGLRTWVNGIEQTLIHFFTQGTMLGNFAVTTTFFLSRAASNFFLQAEIADIRLYSRLPTESEIRLLSSEPGIGFKPAKKLSRFSQRFTYEPPKAKTYSVVRVKETDHANLREGLVGAWCPSIAGSGNLLPDLSGYGNHGTLTNMAADDWVSGQYGRALDFDGTDDFCNLPFAAFPGSLPFAFSCWFFATNINYQRELVNVTDTGSVDAAFRLLATNTGFMFAAQGDSLASSAASSSSQYQVGWNHAVACFVSASERWVSLNGIRSSSNTDTRATNFALLDAVSLAALRRSSIIYTATQIDDIRIYNRVPTDSEIRILASRPGIGLRQEQHRQTFYQTNTRAQNHSLISNMF